MSELYHMFFYINSSISIKEVLVIAVISVVMGIFVDIIYQITHTHVQADPFFHASLLAAPLVCAVVIYSANGIGVLCLAVVTALYGLFVGKMNHSRIKDARIFLVWSIACGVLCGEEKFLIGAIVSIMIFFIFLFFKLIDNMPYILIIKGLGEHRMEAQAAVFDLFGKRARLINGDFGSSYELTYKISAIVLRKLRRQGIDLVGSIRQVQGVENVLIGKEEQTDEW